MHRIYGIFVLTMVACGGSTTPAETAAEPAAKAVQTTPAATQQPVEHAAAHGATYTCPMHPEVVSDKPGDCPKCGMALEEAKPAAPAETPPAP